MQELTGQKNGQNPKIKRVKSELEVEKYNIFEYILVNYTVIDMTNHLISYIQHNLS